VARDISREESHEFKIRSNGRVFRGFRALRTPPEPRQIDPTAASGWKRLEEARIDGALWLAVEFSTVRRVSLRVREKELIGLLLENVGLIGSRVGSHQ